MDEFEEVFGDWLVDTVQVHTFVGPGPKGPILADPQAVDKCMVNYKNRLVRASETEERVSDAQLVTLASNAARFLPESRVVLPDLQVRTVLSVSSNRLPGMPNHTRVVLV